MQGGGTTDTAFMAHPELRHPNRSPDKLRGYPISA
jgi:hypothetical protein